MSFRLAYFRSTRPRRGSFIFNHLHHDAGGRASYSSKVRAFPFMISKEDAICQMAPYASLATFNTPVRDVIARFIPGSFDLLRPSRLQPLYFPCWYIDAVLGASIWLKAYGPGEQVSAIVDLSGSYLPGYPYEPVSRLSFNEPELETMNTVPFSDDLKYHDGDEVPCLPYTISPFSVLDIARSIDPEEAVIDKDVGYQPSSVKANFLAAYPVLYPVYLAQYDIVDPVTSAITQKSKVPVVLDANSRKGRLAVWPIWPSNFPDFFVPREEILEFRDSSTRGFAAANVDELGWPIKVAKWLDSLITQPGATAKLAKNRIVDMSLPWIREFSRDEILKNRSWIRQMDRTKREEGKPEWWKEWETLQSNH